MKNTTTTTTEVVTTPAVVVELTPLELIKKYGTTSGAIRALTLEGKTRSEVAKMLNIRYQHVRNVLITPIKKAKVVTQ